MSVLLRLIQLERKTVPETIGDPECPLIHRWTLYTWGDGNLTSKEVTREDRPKEGGKLLLHRFLSRADDRHVHDHPRGFWTFVFWGRYDDMGPCPECKGEPPRRIGRGGTVWLDGKQIGTIAETRPCPCGGSGVVLRERMSFGKLRYRPAEHQHRTQVGPNGCWTIVVMGRLERLWGFWRGGIWMEFEEYIRRYRAEMRCD